MYLKELRRIFVKFLYLSEKRQVAGFTNTVLEF